jgi:hypothetical protein
VKDKIHSADGIAANFGKSKVAIDGIDFVAEWILSSVPHDPDGSAAG